MNRRESIGLLDHETAIDNFYLMVEIRFIYDNYI